MNAKSKPKGGINATLILTPKMIEEAKLLSGRGLTRQQIAHYFGYSANTFRAAQERQPEIEQAMLTGKAKTISYVSGKLMDAVRKGNLSAIIFYLKTQARWHEFDKIAHDGQTHRDFPAVTLTVNDPVEAAKIYQKFITEA